MLISLANLLLALTLLTPDTGVSAASLNQTIEITAPAHSQIVNFVMQNAKKGTGAITDPYTTYVNQAHLSLAIAGSGQITVKDSGGNTVYSFTKTASDTETFNFVTPLNHGVGRYEFTVTLEDPNNPGTIYDSRTLYISFLATSPTEPDAPDTGVLYFGARAFVVQDLVVVLGLAAIIAIVIVLSIRRTQKSRKFTKLTKPIKPARPTAPAKSAAPAKRPARKK